VLCEAPDARLEAAFDNVEPGPDWEAQVPPGWEGGFQHGLGVLAADLNHDGRVDVLLPDESRPQLFIQQADGTLRAETAERLPTPPELAAVESWQCTTASAADADGDGDLDLLLGISQGPDRLFVNDGGGHFTDVTIEAGLPLAGRRLSSAPWGDVDGDGDLDLFLGYDAFEERPPEPAPASELLLNDGAGHFTSASERLNTLQRTGYTKVAGFFDLDADGDQDLYIVNHQAAYVGNQLLINDGAGGFYEDPASGLGLVIAGMGLGVGDLNGDGLPDLMLSDWGSLWLMESLSPGVWYDGAAARGLSPALARDQVVAWGNELVDLDNDGLLDALVVFGPASTAIGESNPEEQPDGVWLGRGDGTLRHQETELGLDQLRNSRGLAVTDFDGDGWLDLLRGGVDHRARLDIARCGEAAWLAVEPVGEAPNTFAVGARVEVEVAGVVQTRWVHAASTSLHSASVGPAHFGLGDAEAVDRLTVIWPDGARSTWRDVAARQRVTALRAEAAIE